MSGAVAEQDRTAALVLGAARLANRHTASPASPAPRPNGRERRVLTRQQHGTPRGLGSREAEHSAPRDLTALGKPQPGPARPRRAP